MPLGIAFTLGELQNLHGMFIGVFEVESFNAARVFVPIRQPLRTGGGVLDSILSQNRVGAVHVVDGYRYGSYRSNMNLLASSRDRRKRIGLRPRSRAPSDAEGDRYQQGTEYSRQHAVVPSRMAPAFLFFRWC